MSIAMHDVSFRYPQGKGKVLAGVNLHVRRGEAVAVMAPSGQGKSTLLALAGFLLTPSEGRVLLDGDVPGRATAVRLLGRRIQWIPQSVNLLPRRSIRDNLLLPALAQGEKRTSAQRRVREVMDAYGLDMEGGRQARRLSGGQAQRVAVARALMADPVVVLADEPTANLDAATARSVAGMLFSVTADVTLLVATHDPAVAQLADRTLRLDNGEVVAEP